MSGNQAILMDPLPRRHGDFLTADDQLARPYNRKRRRQVYSKARKNASHFHHIFQTILILGLIFMLAQALRGVVSFGVQISQLLKNQPVIQRYHGETVHENHRLAEQIRLYSSPSGMEELARNSLHLVGENEVLVRFY